MVHIDVQGSSLLVDKFFQKTGWKCLIDGASLAFVIQAHVNQNLFVEANNTSFENILFMPIHLLGLLLR